MKSTSIHSLNADTGLNLFQKIAYLFLNFLNNLFPYSNLDKRIRFRKFGNLDWEKELNNTYAASSPGRRLSDIFWRALPWGEMQEELGEIHVFDTGCGSGNYGVRLMDASGGRISSYTGIDAKEKPTWKELQQRFSNFKLVASNSNDIYNLIPKNVNLFITQSAIEHFDKDLNFFGQIKKFIDNTDKPVIQIHNFPARAILPLYLFHGIRQYTPRTASKITNLFKGSLIYMYGLGGKAAKKVQWKYFTWPLLILRKNATWSDDIDKYNKEVIQAVEYDTAHPTKFPLFWVMIIHSNFKKKIW